MRHESWNLTGSGPAPADGEAAHEALASEFDAWADAGRGDSMEAGHWPTARQALERVPWHAVRTFVDLGCGNGYAVRHAAGRIDPAGEAIGIDVSPQMVAQAGARTEDWLVERQQRGEDSAGLRFEVARFEALPFSDASIDVVFTNEALYYAPDVDRALREVHRVLRPGGAFVCGIDYFEENTYSHDWPDRVGVPMLRDSAAGWRQRLQDAGFHDVATERLLDASGVPDAPADEDAAARAAHDALVRWKTEVGTLLIVATRPQSG